jgi:hypothetical protein
MPHLAHTKLSDNAGPRECKALNLAKLATNNFACGADGKSLCFDHLPTDVIDLDAQSRERIAILSWRWDVNQDSNSSRNAYIACQEAIRQGVQYLILDKVTVDQNQGNDEMLVQRLAFSKLYQELPVIAAYDHASPQVPDLTAEVHGTRVKLGSPFVRIIRRPWIVQEAQLYRSNPTKVTYVGHLEGLGCDENWGFLHMLPRVWESTLTQTILYTLRGLVSMHCVEDFRFIMPQYFALLSEAHAQMSSNDYLLTAALLAGHADKSDGRVNNDQDIRGIAFRQYQIGPGYAPDDMPKTQDYYTRYDISLRDRKIAEWQTRHKLYPFEELRVWFRIRDSVEHTIREMLGVQESPSGVTGTRSYSGDLGPQRPTLQVVFHEEDRLG